MYTDRYHAPGAPIVAEFPRRRIRIHWPRLLGCAGALSLSVCAYAALMLLAAMLRQLPPIG